ncbi:TPA: LuxR family transcriptional regulator [Candidatus Gastranaerophilales bacterium HUM_20]|nr:transcriptional regulator LuxR family [Clostridium sp. CAG:729]DAB19919.1 MAG TPA: LuxR family transcriptional regulator [Candidatus Gastranaerophilales bacterium HUM_20]
MLLTRANAVYKGFEMGYLISLQYDLIDSPNLTARELELLKLLCNGDSNVKIAKKLSISIHTSRAHVESILKKLRVKIEHKLRICVVKIM